MPDRPLGRVFNQFMVDHRAKQARSVPPPRYLVRGLRPRPGGSPRSRGPAGRAARSGRFRWRQGAVKNALLMAFISAKHAQRGNDWTTPSQMTHLATCIGTVEWLLEHGSPPVFDDRVGLPLPMTMPVTFDDRRAWIRESVRSLIVRLEAELPSVVADLEAAIDSLERWLQAGAIRNRSSSQAPPDTPPSDPPAPPDS